MVDNYNGIVLTSYFTSKPDPQRVAFAPANSVDYMSGWYESLRALGMKGIVFHDGLSERFVAERTVVDSIQFVRCDGVGDSIASVNDQRFQFYRNYLRNVGGGGHDWVLLTDIADVRFVRNPFEFMQAHQGFRLFFGTDGPYIGSSRCMVERFTQFYGEVFFPELRILNAGVIGGRRREIEVFLDMLTTEITQYSHLGNCNMPAVNRVAYGNYGLPELWCGTPFTSLYKHNEDPESTLAYIVHK